MNLSKSKVVLKKINTLHDNILLSGTMSKIEKDLFLDYLRDMYELILEKDEDSEVESSHPLQMVRQKNPAQSQTGPNEVVEQIEEVVVEEKEDPQYEMVEVAEEYGRANGHAIEGPVQLVKETVTTSKAVSAEIENLFNEESINQHSYRFSQTPIIDISKAMGINEKILTINQLFNKDQQEFNYVAAKLNYFNTFEEASQFLKTEVAEKYKWDAESKRAEAIDFIRLVSRKYAS